MKLELQNKKIEVLKIENEFATSKVEKISTSTKQHCKRKKMDDMKVMFVFKHIDQKPFCNDKIH